MTLPTWHEEPISRKHKRMEFACGESELDEYLRCYARKNHENGGSKTWVATPDGEEVLGFYSLSLASVHYQRVPEVLARVNGRYDFPAFRLGRLAVDQTWQGQGLGGTLLVAAARRCIRVSAEVGGSALLIDAKNERVAGWYESLGAISLLDTPLSLLLPLASIARAIEH